MFVLITAVSFIIFSVRISISIASQFKNKYDDKKVIRNFWWSQIKLFSKNTKLREKLIHTSKTCINQVKHAMINCFLTQQTILKQCFVFIETRLKLIYWRNVGGKWRKMCLKKKSEMKVSTTTIPLFLGLAFLCLWKKRNFDNKKNHTDF